MSTLRPQPHLPALLALAAATQAGSALACASCGCTVNSDWSAQGLASSSGWSLDLRYDYLDQNRLREGTHGISPAAASIATNTQTGEPAEVEKYTKNHYFTATLDYTDGQAWGVSVTLPVIDRSHETLGVGSDGATFDPTNGAYTSSATGLGDVRLLARYFGFSEARNVGVQLGLKLPTGRKNQVAGGGSIQPVDPGLQLGTGSTDVIVGVYAFGDLAADWGYFAQATFQAALNHGSMADGAYKPGDSINLSLGARYRGFASFIPTAQLNIRDVKTDSGEAADTYSTGGKLAYLTLGVIVPATPTFAPYANVQVPAYQNVNGIQLTPKYIVSVGAKMSF